MEVVHLFCVACPLFTFIAAHMKTTPLLLFFCLLHLVVKCQSTYLAYDPMTGVTANNLHASSGGSGWAGIWHVQNGNNTGYVFDSAGLHYLSLQTTGGCVKGGYSWQQTGRYLDTQPNGAFGSYINTGSIGSQYGTTLYTSFLLQKNQSNNEAVYMSLHNSNIDWCMNCTNQHVAVGYFGSASNTGNIRYWSLQIGDSVFQSNIPIAISQTVFIVLRSTFTATQTFFDVYINPTTLGNAGIPPTPSLSAASQTPFEFRNAGLYLGDQTNNGKIDEIRFASSYAVASPDSSILLNLPPVSSFTMSASSGAAPLTVLFNGTSSFDPEGLPLTYAWDFGDGSPVVTGPSVITHTYSPGLVGQINVTLSVNDNLNQQHSSQQTITLFTPGTNSFPCQASVTNLQEATCTQPAGRIRVNTGVAVNPIFTVHTSNGNLLSPVNYNEFHSLAAGNYQVHVSDNSGCVDSFDITMTVDSTTCIGWQSALCNMSVGVNVNGLADWNWEHAFVNRYKHVRGETITFHDACSCWNTNVENELSNDADGYPLYIPQNTSAASATKIRYVLSSDNGNLKANEQYVFLYDGVGTLTIHGVIVNSNTAGRILFTVPASSGNIWLDIHASQTGNHLRHFRLLQASDEYADLSVHVFNPTFLSRLSPFKAIRFMDWGATNNSPLTNWSQRATNNMRTYGTSSGVPYERMIELANLTQKDLWICVPHAADSNYMAQMAMLFEQNLHPNLTVYLEYSNEVWNWIFGQAHFNNDNRPMNLNYGRAYAEKAKNVFQIWTNVFAGQQGRLKRVLGLQGGNSFLNTEILAQLPQHLWDIGSLSYYFGLDHSNSGNPVLNAASTGTDVNLNARNAFFGPNGWFQLVKQDYRNIKIYGKEVNSYEGGQHYSDFQFHPYQQAMYDAQYLPGMYTLYDNVLDSIRNIGNTLAMAFTLSGRQESVYGSWGHLPDMYMAPPYNTSGTPKYKALLDNSCLPFVDVPTQSTLHLTMFIEGYYQGMGLMIPTMTTQQYLPAPLSNDVDDITVELHTDIPPYTMVASSLARLKTDGTAACLFPLLNGNYYIVIKHRNGLETWSANPVFISSNTNYDFTIAANHAYGNNQIEVEPGIWAFYSGDINQDENVDLLDLSIQEADISNFEFGYYATDINGDGNVDLLDLPLLEANINGFVFSTHP